MNDNKNMILAIALSVIVLLGWGLAPNILPPANPPVARVEKGGRAPPPSPVRAQPGPVPSRRFARPRSAPRRHVLAETPRVRIETPRLAGSINLKGARRRPRPHPQGETVAQFAAGPAFSPAGTQHSISAAGWSGDAAGARPDTVWQADGTRLTPTSRSP